MALKSSMHNPKKKEPETFFEFNITSDVFKIHEQQNQNCPDQTILRVSCTPVNVPIAVDDWFKILGLSESQESEVVSLIQRNIVLNTLERHRIK